MSELTNIGEKRDLRSTLKEFGLPRMIIAAFLLLMLIVAPFTGANFWSQITNVFNRFSWNAVLVLAMVIYSRIKRSDTMMRFGMISMISGAAANLIDRFQNGLVVDFLDFRIWPVFNIADIAIVLGTCFMVYSLMFKFSETTSAQE